MRARSSTGWAGGEARYDGGLKAYKQTRPTPRCSTLLPWLGSRQFHLVPGPVSTSVAPAAAQPRRPLRFDHARYDGFGGTVASTGSTSNTYLYRGEAYDAQLRLQYLRARYSRPNAGIFLTGDPIEPCGESGCDKNYCTGHLCVQSTALNRYVYALADPVNHDDPTGKIARTSQANLLLYLVAATSATASYYYSQNADAANVLVTMSKATIKGLSCSAHFALCQGYGWPWTDPTLNTSFGHSRCRECMITCEGLGRWPDSCGSGGCRYWEDWVKEY
ncbi:RHS repeat-associated core domain-containing protein [Paludibaculum fermentans]|uniref:RHS repeat-associated core domain-containing protein n=1 Tax=Paludibaculum fermentans TaxID=1473598 RepID=UPI003EBBA874